MITYESTLDDVREEDLDGFFEGWPVKPSARRHLLLLRGSDHVILARESETGRVVGFVTAVGDGVLSAFIPLLEVLPGFQGQGIGTELVRRMLAELEGTYMVDLGCDEDLVAFYERVGMWRTVGMALRDRTALVE